MLPKSDERFDATPSNRSDRADLRAQVVSQLAATPIDDQALRNSVWTYAGAVREGISPGRVIRAFTRLVDAAGLTPALVHRETMRKVTLWCVEAQFGQLGGAALPNGGATLRLAPDHD